MSSPPSSFPPPARFDWIRPRWFLGGLVAGLGFLAWAGWRTSRRDYHPGFVRFHSMISPESNYYPTLDEMCAIVRARCRPDQVLVIVGGNSVLLGVWQDAAEVWSNRLQQLLGDHYCVINFAFRGGCPTDCGAVVAEALRREFPRQILIVNEAALTGDDPFGSGPYRYVFWQGYFGGKLLDDPRRDARIREFFQTDPDRRRALLETRLSVWFDDVFHYHDFWNRVAFDYLCTVSSYEKPVFPSFLEPRRDFADPEVDGTLPKYDGDHYRLAYVPAEMRIVRGPLIFYHRDAEGDWRLAPATRSNLTELCENAFPDALKARTLVLISGNSPYYVRLLRPQELALDHRAFDDTVAIWRKAGYPAMQYGWNFTDQDFGDRTHLTKFGGWKLAAKVAPEVRAIAQGLGYLP